MTELKTLKDFKEWGSPTWYEKVRAEGVKWIKDSEDKKKRGIRPLLKDYEWIKHFLNLNEKDLEICNCPKCAEWVKYYTELAKKYTELAKDCTKEAKDYTELAKYYTERAKKYTELAKYYTGMAKYCTEWAKKYANKCQCEEQEKKNDN